MTLDESLIVLAGALVGGFVSGSPASAPGSPRSASGRTRCRPRRPRRSS
jgi:hypothetical protein